MERQQLVNLLQVQHGLTCRSIEGLSQETFTTIPDKFKNNILWHAGHIPQVMSSLVYRPAGQDHAVPAHFNDLFKNGTSPADWSETPSIEEVTEVLTASGTKACEDLMNGAFDDFNAFELFPGFTIESGEQALVFHIFHAALHVSSIGSIKKLVA